MLRVVLFHDPDFWTGCLIQRRIGQATAPLLVIQWVTNKSTFTNNDVVSDS